MQFDRLADGPRANESRYRRNLETGNGARRYADDRPSGTRDARFGGSLL